MIEPEEIMDEEDTNLWWEGLYDPSYLAQRIHYMIEGKPEAYFVDMRYDSKDVLMIAVIKLGAGNIQEGTHLNSEKCLGFMPLFYAGQRTYKELAGFSERIQNHLTIKHGYKCQPLFTGYRNLVPMFNIWKDKGK